MYVMSKEATAKSACADATADCDMQEDFEDLADLANTYLLSPQELSEDLTVRILFDPSTQPTIMLKLLLVYHTYVLLCSRGYCHIANLVLSVKYECLAGSHSKMLHFGRNKTADTASVCSYTQVLKQDIQGTPAEQIVELSPRAARRSQLDVIEGTQLALWNKTNAAHE